MPATRTTTTGVVLAGGRGSRLGGLDKGLIQLQGQALVAYALGALTQVCDRVVISANRNHADYARFGYPVVGDASDTFEGPLAGVYSAMKASGSEHLLVIPCDSPLMTGAGLSLLFDTYNEQSADACIADDGQRVHPVFLLLAHRLLDSLERFLASGQRKVGRWLERHSVVHADYSAQPELFANVNTADDLARLEAEIAERAFGRSSGDRNA